MRHLCLTILVVLVASTLPSGPSMASPVPDFTCRIPPGTSLQRDGYSLGESIYVYGDKLAMEGYQDPAEQLSLTSEEGDVSTYSDGDVSVHISAYGAEIELKSGMMISCEFAPPDDGLTEGADGIAMGATVREEPSINGRKLQRLEPGEEIFISENIGNTYDGYDWFKIQYNKGRIDFMSEAFVWGGTICSVGFEVPGLAGEC